MKPTPTLLIDDKHSHSRYWKELWEFRELVYFLAWRDLLVRYKQTAIGVLWAIGRPILVMLALTLVFGKIVNLSAHETTPYPLLVLSALLPWLFFAGTVADCSESIINNANLVSKIYFPRMIIPISVSIVTFFDFAITLLLILPVMGYYGIFPGIKILLLPIITLHLILLTFGTGLWISALNAKYRDFRYVIPFFLQFGLYITPVGFSSNIIPEKWHFLYGINPLVGIIEEFRWLFLGGDNVLYWPTIGVSLFFTILLCWGGVTYFRKMERNFADII